MADFASGATEDAINRWRDRLGEDGGLHQDTQAIADWAQNMKLDQVVTPYGATGPAKEMLDELEEWLSPKGIDLIRVINPYDSRAWPHATHGFFRFKEHIPSLLDAMAL
ncbi:MAG TPA: hypothetical protein VJ942_09575 [Roseovarius sp.]|nr:hypothetical protein [Roseovarius sp.]